MNEQHISFIVEIDAPGWTNNIEAARSLIYDVIDAALTDRATDLGISFSIKEITHALNGIKAIINGLKGGDNG